MPMYNFSVGTLVGRRNGVDSSGAAIVNPTPARFGVVQDIQVDFDRTLKELQGQYQFPVDIAAGPFKIRGKAKFADIQARVYNDLFFGQTIVPSTGELVAVDESTIVAATNTVVHAATFLHDLGVRYLTTSIVLVRVASGPATGQYAVNEATGVYTFAAGDVGVTVLISYSYGATTMQEITLTNQPMGISPSFEIHLQSFYPNSVSSLVNQFNLKLNACKASKLSLPFKNVDYILADFEFQAFADASNNVGTVSFTQ